MRRITFVCMIICAGLTAAGCKTTSEKSQDEATGINLGLYQSKHEDGLGLVRLIPVFSHRYDEPADAHSTFIWPLLSGWGRWKEKGDRHTNYVTLWPLLSSYSWGRREEDRWSVFANLLVTRVSARTRDPAELNSLSNCFGGEWLPMLRPLFIARGLDGRQRLSFTGLRPLLGIVRQKADNGSSSQFALFPLVSTFNAELTLEAQERDRRIKKSSVVVPVLLAKSELYQDDEPGRAVVSENWHLLWPMFHLANYHEEVAAGSIDTRETRLLGPVFSSRHHHEDQVAGTLEKRRHDLLWPLICRRQAVFTPEDPEAEVPTKNYSRLLPIYSREVGPALSRFTLWPLLMRWERTDDGMFFRPLLFFKFRTGS